jgi:hypothetical protein
MCKKKEYILSIGAFFLKFIAFPIMVVHHGHWEHNEPKRDLDPSRCTGG